MKKIKTRFVLICIYLLYGIISSAQTCWQPLGSGVNSFPPRYIETMISYNGKLIAAGTFDSIGSIAASGIAQWDGSAWQPLGSGLKIDSAYSYSLDVPSLAVYNGDLYVAGQFDTAGTVRVHNIARWDGTSWASVGAGLAGSDFTVLALAVYGRYLYAGGRFDTADGHVCKKIARWDGSVWSEVDSGIQQGSVVYSLATDDHHLYVGGDFAKVASIPAANIASWNDTVWSPMAGGADIGGGGVGVTSLCSIQGYLYAAVSGYFQNKYTDSIVRWDGTVWTNIGGLHITSANIGADVLLAFNNNLVIGGGFDTIGATYAANLAQWDGSGWSIPGAVGGGFFPQINALAIYDSHLIVSGSFTTIDSVSAYNVAEYTCATTGISTISADAIQLYPNPGRDIIHIFVPDMQLPASIDIYDLTGSKVMQVEMDNANGEINMRDKAPGVYLYHLRPSAGPDMRGRFVLE